MLTSKRPRKSVVVRVVKIEEKKKYSGGVVVAITARSVYRGVYVQFDVQPSHATRYALGQELLLNVWAVIAEPPPPAPDATSAASLD